MNKYTLKYDKRFIKDLEKIPVQLRLKIKQEIEDLAINPRPHGHIKISGSSNLYRIRIGDYRVCYEIHDGILIIVLVIVGHRREVYDKL